VITIAILIAMIGLAGLVGIGVAFIADRSSRYREAGE
jgi:hypothetical protein